MSEFLIFVQFLKLIVTLFSIDEFCRQTEQKNSLFTTYYLDLLNH